VCRTAIAVACRPNFTLGLNLCDIPYVVNYTKFALITTILSGQQPGNENYRVPGSRQGTRVTGSNPGTRVPVPSTNVTALGLVGIKF